ncbi:bifunctional folylpolyglutamate synthase/dihydrofolate synthase [Patescibacteria group bacterium]
MNQFEKYYQANEFLEGLYNLRAVTKQYGRAQNPEIYIRRMKYFLKLLGNPEKNMKYIHITGTAGKGSVANMVHTVLVQNKLQVGLFTSPFATSAIEKIKVGNFYIGPNEFAKIVQEIKPAIDQAFKDNLGPSYFEIFFAIALIYFKKQQCKWVVLEVGAGGKYDATNIIPKPEVAVITNIDFDHMHLLGNTLTKIATDKAGIIKKHTIFWTAEKRPHLIKIFKKVCKEKNAKFNQINTKLFDGYQGLNRELVRKVSGEINIPNIIIEKTIKNTKALPCRFEKVQKNPIVILDGAHNSAKMKSTITNIQKLKYKKLFCIVAFAENKKLQDVLDPLLPLAYYVFATRFEIKERTCADPNTIFQTVRKYKNKKIITDLFMDPNQALNQAFKLASAKDLILVTGSFFLAGELRKKWFDENYILKNRTSY